MTGDGAPTVRRPLRFGAVTPLGDDVGAWRDQVRRLADVGCSTVLMPDVPGWQPVPAATLAVAATLADVRVGTWVYAGPVRPAWTTAWEAHSLTRLTQGRFEMGIGVGRPGLGAFLRELGLPSVPRAERLEQIRDVVTALRELDGPDLRTPVVMAAGGPRGLALAVEIADTVNVAVPPTEPRAETARRVQGLEGAADVELALHVPVVGDTVAPFMAGPWVVPADVRAVDSVTSLPADPAAAAEEVQRRREELGFSYYVLGAAAAEVLAPMITRLGET